MKANADVHWKDGPTPSTPVYFRRAEGAESMSDIDNTQNWVTLRARHRVTCQDCETLISLLEQERDALRRELGQIDVKGDGMNDFYQTINENPSLSNDVELVARLRAGVRFLIDVPGDWEFIVSPDNHFVLRRRRCSKCYEKGAADERERAKRDCNEAPEA